MSTAPEAFSRLLEVLGWLEIPYAVGGSVASSSHGIPRTTLAFARGRAANLIHLSTAWKLDVFPLGTDEYSRTEFGRRAFRQPVESASAEEAGMVPRGRERSERPWNDCLGVCRTVGRQLDIEYLRRWAGHLKVEDLLEKVKRGFKAGRGGIPSSVGLEKCYVPPRNE